MNIDAKILNEIKGSQIQQHIKMDTHHDQLDSSWVTRMVQCDTPHKQKEGESHKIIPINTEKALDKTQHPFLIKTNNVGIEGPHLNIIKTIYDKPTAN